jgi:voltage-gated potassium channel
VDLGQLVEASRSRLRIPRRYRGPVRTIALRLGMALGLVLLAAVTVYLGRGGYRDSAGRPVSWLTAFYYSVVTLTTIGYGDVVPVSDRARLVNCLIITPLRLGFLFLLVGTTLRALTERTRAEWREQRWRRAVRGHALLIGYGTKGRAAVATLLAHGYRARDIVVVDCAAHAVADANRAGLVGIVGDGTRRAVLERAEIGTARHVLVTAGRDDTAVLAVLTARRLNPAALITASVNQTENGPLLREGGAAVVITSTETAGGLVGEAAVNPTVGTVIEKIISGGLDLRVVERPPAPSEVGRTPQQVLESVVSVVRDGLPLPYDDPQVGAIRPDDQLVVVRSCPDAGIGVGVSHEPAVTGRRRFRRPRYVGSDDDE